MVGRHRYVVALALAAAIAGLWQADRAVLQGKRSADPRKPPPVPERIGDWRGQEIPIRPEDAALLPRTEILMRRYHIPGEPKALGVDLATVSTRDMSAFHNPDSCYQAAGWTIIDKQPLTIEISEPNPPNQDYGPRTTDYGPGSKVSQRSVVSGQWKGDRVVVERLLVEKNGARMQVFYWYTAAGGLGGDPGRTHTSRLGILFNALRWGGTRPATFFRVTTFATGGETEAERRSTRFIRALLQTIRRNEG